MLYTRKGDGGTTKTFGCDQRVSKSSAIAEALGTLDEVNSFLGICKIRSKEKGYTVAGRGMDEVVHWLQSNLFIVQAELAGADKRIAEEKVKEVERIVDTIESELPPIKSFFISGGTELAATFDVARTIARRAERRVTAVADEGTREVSVHTKAFLNRLSSILYALARYANHLGGITEQSPDYS
jgi:cob(I)alamin adenosyltransferase